MRLAVMQPYFFPYIGYFQLINLVDEFVLYNDVNYIKRGWINRNKILVNKDAKYITIPLVKVSQNKKINETEINYDISWQDKISKAIEFSYKNAPYYKNVLPLIQKTLAQDFDTIDKLASYSIKSVCEYLQTDTEFINSADLNISDELKGQDRIIKICEQRNATSYINPPNGRSLYDEDSFTKRNMKLNFLDPKINSYQQFNNDFIPGLSIIDVLMFNDPERVNKMLNKFILA